MFPGCISPASSSGISAAHPATPSPADPAPAVPVNSVSNAEASSPLQADGPRHRRHDTPTTQGASNQAEPAHRPPPGLRLKSRYGSLIDDPDCLRQIASTYARYERGQLVCGIRECPAGSASSANSSRDTDVFGYAIGWLLFSPESAVKPVDYPADAGLAGVRQILAQFEQRCPPAYGSRTHALKYALHEALSAKIVQAVRRSRLSDEEGVLMEQIEESFSHALANGTSLSRYAECHQPYSPAARGSAPRRASQGPSIPAAELPFPRQAFS